MDSKVIKAMWRISRGTFKSNHTAVYVLWATFIWIRSTSWRAIKSNMTSYSCEIQIDVFSGWHCEEADVFINRGWRCADWSSAQHWAARDQQRYRWLHIHTQVCLMCSHWLTVWLCWGGCCFKPETSKEALQLFEMETVLSMELRKEKKHFDVSSINTVVQRLPHTPVILIMSVRKEWLKHDAEKALSMFDRMTWTSSGRVVMMSDQRLNYLHRYTTKWLWPRSKSLFLLYLENLA